MPEARGTPSRRDHATDRPAANQNAVETLDGVLFPNLRSPAPAEAAPRGSDQRRSISLRVRVLTSPCSLALRVAMGM